jgi:hypothetical protein
MGKLNPAANDRAASVAEGTLNVVGAGAGAQVISRTNFTLSGDFVGTARLERSFDGGQTWTALTAGGQVIEFTNPVSEELDELEDGVLYRVRLVALTSGTLAWRFSR